MNSKLKALVRPEGVGSEILLAIWISEKVYQELGATQFCITSLSDGRHKAGSKHHCGKAVDLRIWTLPKDKWEQAAKIIQHRLGATYFVLLESNHIHIQYNGF